MNVAENDLQGLEMFDIETGERHINPRFRGIGVIMTVHPVAMSDQDPAVFKQLIACRRNVLF